MVVIQAVERNAELVRHSTRKPTARKIEFPPTQTTRATD